jgi:hypothetical protein
MKRKLKINLIYSVGNFDVLMIGSKAIAGYVRPPNVIPY